MNAIKEVNAFGGQEKKTKFLLGTYFYSDPCEDPYLEELGIRINIVDSMSDMIGTMKRVAKALGEDIEDIRFDPNTPYSSPDSYDNDGRVFRFISKEDGEWKRGYGLFLREYIRYENDSKEFKELIDEGVLEVI